MRLSGENRVVTLARSPREEETAEIEPEDARPEDFENPGNVETAREDANPAPPEANPENPRE
jgi:hypothetical protein